MPVPARDPRWKVGFVRSEDVDHLANDVQAAAANLKGIIMRATQVQAGIEHQMGGEFAGMAKLLRPMRTLEEASEKLDMASWSLQDFAAKFKKVSL